MLALFIHETVKKPASQPLGRLGKYPIFTLVHNKSHFIPKANDKLITTSNLIPLSRHGT